MRARNIKPGFFKNEDLAKCSFSARLLFEGLWCYADREGRFEWRPSRIKVEIFPYDRVKIDELLDQLIEYHFVFRYEIDGCVYGFIPTFVDHQRPHPHEAPSRLPPPSEELLNEINVIARSYQRHTNDIPCPSDIRNEDTRNKDIPEWLDLKIWENFREHRIAIKSRMTPHAEKLILNKLIDFKKRGIDPHAELNRSIECGWKSVFEPKYQSQSPAPSKNYEPPDIPFDPDMAKKLRTLRKSFKVKEME